MIFCYCCCCTVSSSALLGFFVFSSDLCALFIPYTHDAELKLPVRFHRFRLLSINSFMCDDAFVDSILDKLAMRIRYEHEFSFEAKFWLCDSWCSRPNFSRHNVWHEWLLRKGIHIKELMIGSRIAILTHLFDLIPSSSSSSTPRHILNVTFHS